MPKKSLGRDAARIAAVLAATVITSLAVQPPAYSVQREAVAIVRGVVKDTTGALVPGLTVRLIKTRTVYSLRPPRSQEQGVDETRVRTGPEGAFELEFPIDPTFHAYFVRFFDPKLFDAVKYRLPRDLDITRHVEAGRTVQANMVLELQPTWPQVKALVDEYGAASPLGQILRTLGLPTRREAEGEGRELWHFEAAGVSYLVDGDRVVETRRTGAATDGDGPGKPAAEGEQPAEQVDEP